MVEDFSGDLISGLVQKLNGPKLSDNGQVFKCHLNTRLNLIWHSSGDLNIRVVKVHYLDDSVIQISDISRSPLYL